jgi:hypothetical protein
MIYVARKLGKVQRVVDEDVPQMKVVLFGPVENGRHKYEEGIEDMFKVADERGKKNDARVKKNAKKLTRCIRLFDELISVVTAPRTTGGFQAGNTGRYQIISTEVKKLREMDAEEKADDSESPISEDDNEE